MTEIVSLADAVKDIGIPALFFVVIMYILFKTVPGAIKAKQEADAKQQEYYAQRQKQYDEQMQQIVRVAEQGAQAISRANIVTENNTAAIKQNTDMHNKVIDALTRDYDETQEIRKSLAAHDTRAENVHRDVIRLLERSGEK
jgi:hypothetical protein